MKPQSRFIFATELTTIDASFFTKLRYHKTAVSGRNFGNLIKKLKLIVDLKV